MTKDFSKLEKNVIDGRLISTNSLTEVKLFNEKEQKEQIDLNTDLEHNIKSLTVDKNSINNLDNTLIVRSISSDKLMLRDFEEVAKQFKKHDSETTLPIRADSRSAGYDFFSKETVKILPNGYHIFWTDVKAYMQPHEFLDIRIRSSLGFKDKSLMIKNTTGVVDSSYYNNPTNDGNIGISIYNFGQEPVLIEEGERIAQGIFQMYLLTTNDVPLHNERIGGVGSSNR